MMLENLFKQHNVPLWGIASMSKVIDSAEGYKCIVFCLPYDIAAIASLPDDELMEKCKKDLRNRSTAVYNAIITMYSDYHFELYDETDDILKLRERGISQKVLAHLAGLGWIGRSSLLITSRFGPRVRIGTIFTKGDLDAAGHPFSGDCRECTACAEICPSGAISKNAFDVNKCREIVTDARGEYETFCGLCMRVCPIGSINLNRFLN